MKHKVFRSIIALMFVIGLIALHAPQSANAAGTWYVATTGDNSSDCLSPSTPCETINGTIGKAVDGDTIKVATGTYTSNSTAVVFINKDLTITGGWDSSFAHQDDFSTIDSQMALRGGISVSGLPVKTAHIDRFIIRNSLNLPGVANSGILTISNSTIHNNSYTYGGGIFNSNSLTLINVTVSNNSAWYGGGIRNVVGSISLNNTTVNNNSASYEGGGIQNLNGRLSITDSTVSNNTAYTGGGIYNSGGNVSLTNSIVSENTTEISGSGIRNLGRLTLRDITVMNNSATGNGVSGAGIANEGLADIFNSSIVGNTSTNIGAGIGNWGLFRLINSTVSGNSPGGIVNSAKLDMYNATITDNKSSSVGGGIFNFNIATLSNTIIAGNFGSAGSQDCFGTLTSRGYNLIQNITGCTISGDTTGNLLGVDPVLGPLQDNGGPTFTHALLTGSPAIDTGDPAGCMDLIGNLLTIDQRGVSRSQGTACDIGAFEYVPPIVVPIDIKPDSETNPINPNSHGKIPVAILSTADFDAPSMVNVSSLTFGRFGNEESLTFCNENGEDVNGDGLLDLVCHFYTQATGFQIGDLEGILKGETVEGTPMEGRDVVTILE